ncbi:MAG: hypothetical protein ACRDOO_27025, partial [Actinomadura sp.]
MRSTYRHRRWTAVAMVIAAVFAGAPAAATTMATAGRAPGDVYTYLDDPERTGEGQEPAHAVLRPYDRESAAVAGGASPFVRSLDGPWRFALADRPGEVPAGFFETGHDTSAWRQVRVPHTWQSDRLDHPVFRNIPTEVWPDDPPKTP